MRLTMGTDLALAAWPRIPVALTAGALGLVGIAAWRPATARAAVPLAAGAAGAAAALATRRRRARRGRRAPVAVDRTWSAALDGRG
jgi:hypothetical protein